MMFSSKMKKRGFRGVFLGSGDDGERWLRGGGVKAGDGLVLVCVIGVQGWSLVAQAVDAAFSCYAAGFSGDLRW
ncbi:hypothetical protein A4A49_37488 [Nicotiana attenuata]|uniref:Uncharacterized protein n=1 Tax=Nicotiana attenuata TaxID=49451 RepID=A0A1J6KHZ5_NICAT|nr:hypothetical protein A4A49_37488 [Nicotiana attenuata]